MASAAAAADAPATPRREPPTVSPGTPTGALADGPPIAALFLIEFDVKAGYTIVWKQAVPGLDLTGAVEYKSLPSGLHAVSEDLIYFVHDETGGDGCDAADGGDSRQGTASSGAPGASTASNGYAGLSAFVNRPTHDASARNARMIAVGVLVPRSYGRLGRAWRHAEALMDMARQLAADGTKLSLLEAYWQSHSPADDEPDRPLLQIADSPLTSPAVSSAPPLAYRPYAAPPPPPPPPFGSRASHTRNRSASDGTALLLPPGHRLSPHHPAWSLTALLDTFGPLIFPIYRAALLRKRILISTHAPVCEVNHFVYNISVLANIPLSALDLLDPAATSLQRIAPLFTIGVNDITFLLDDLAASKRIAREAEAAGAGAADPACLAYGGPGWIACTTDSILAVKEDLWDVLITMPPPCASSAPAATEDKKVWPVVEIAKGVPLKATQRDLRRYKALAAGLGRLAGRPSADGAGSSSGRLFLQDDAQLVEAAESIVEPVTWAALAYNGFMWWASAGEQSRSEETDETIHDAQLLADIVPPRPSQPAPAPNAPAAPADLLDSVTSLTARDADADAANEGEERARLELAIITYFHRLTTQILSVMSDVVESSDDDSDEGYDYNYHDDDDGGEAAYYDDGGAGAAGHGAPDGLVGRAGRPDEDSGLVGARRRGLAPAAPTVGGGGAASASTTALLLRRRGGRARGSGRAASGRASASSSPSSWRRGWRQATGGRATRGAGACTLRVNSDAVSRMGLDVWSQADAAFVRDVARQYFGCRGRHSVYVESKGVEVCGFKIC